MSGVVRQVPLVSQLADRFRELLASGEWAVGHRIPPENQLAAQFEVSRGTVREALRALSLAGLLEPRVGDGTYVRATDELGALLVRDPAAADLDDALDVRAILEGAAAARAATRATPDQVAALESLLRERNAAAARGNVEEYVDADARFHRGLLEAAGNPLLARLYDAVGSRMKGSIELTASLPEDPRLARLHAEVLDHVRAGDPAAAQAAAEAVLAEVRSGGVQSGVVQPGGVQSR